METGQVEEIHKDGQTGSMITLRVTPRKVVRNGGLLVNSAEQWERGSRYSAITEATEEKE